MNSIINAHDGTLFRNAEQHEARTIAGLFRIASGGVADYIWRHLAEPGEEPLDVGARRYARANTEFSYQNCLLAERRGEVVGLLHAYPIAEASAVGPDFDPVLRPYAELEAPGTLYLSCAAVLEGHRNQRIGETFLALARTRAAALGLDGLSALIFAGNAGSRRFAERNGFRAVDRRRVVAHPLLEYDGDVLMYVAGL